MTKWLFKILLIVVSLSFSISAVELNIGECHQTFFDDYDTYVKTEQVSFDYTIVDVPNDHPFSPLASVFSFHYSFAVAQQVSLPHSHTYNLNQRPPKLFLFNSVWRI